MSGELETERQSEAMVKPRSDHVLIDSLVEPPEDLKQAEKMVFINTERSDVAELLEREFREYDAENPLVRIAIENNVTLGYLLVSRYRYARIGPYTTRHEIVSAKEAVKNIKWMFGDYDIHVYH